MEQKAREPALLPRRSRDDDANAGAKTVGPEAMLGSLAPDGSAHGDIVVASGRSCTGFEDLDLVFFFFSFRGLALAALFDGFRAVLGEIGGAGFASWVSAQVAGAAGCSSLSENEASIGTV